MQAAGGLCMRYILMIFINNSLCLVPACTFEENNWGDAGEAHKEGGGASPETAFSSSLSLSGTKHAQL